MLLVGRIGIDEDVKITCGKHVNAAVNLMFDGTWSSACLVINHKGFE